jgi:hypothetical protein
MASYEFEDDRRRYGRDPDPRDAAHLRDYIAGADEHHVPLHPSVADRTWGEAAEDEAGEA